MRLYWRIDELARTRGLTVRRLAESAGLDEKTVRHVMSGRATRVDLETIAALSTALGVPPGALWRTSEAPDWDGTAGAAGEGAPEELEAALSGRWPEPDPALERALRDL